jgi:hypothetical protein
LYHLGVVRLLYEADLLRRVRFITGVSGGAILAAHLALNWNRYAGDPDDFESAAAEVVRFTRKDVRNRILRRWIIGWFTLWPRLIHNWSRVELLRREYLALYGNKDFSAFPDVYKGEGPRVTLQCASMMTGLPCSFGRSGFLLYREHADGRGIRLERDTEVTLTHKLSVAHGVAASSAFPPMFPPLKIDRSMLGSGPRSEYLTDGGVFDNLGMDRPLWWYLQDHSKSADQIGSFLIVDAEGPFNKAAEKAWRYKFMLPRNIRATEILMKRNSTLNWKFLSTLPLELIRVPEPQTRLDAAERKITEDIRTDLDRFSDLEIEELIRSGYEDARSALVNARWIHADASSNWCPVPRSNLPQERRALKLKKSRYRRWLPLFLDVRDSLWWTSFAIVCACLLYLYLLQSGFAG